MVDFDPELETMSMINIYSVIVFEKAKINELGGKMEIDVSKFKAGEYIIQLANNDRIVTEKVLILK